MYFFESYVSTLYILISILPVLARLDKMHSIARKHKNIPVHSIDMIKYQKS